MDRHTDNCAHANALLQRHRCGSCAESVSAVSILRQDDCSFCASPLVWNVSENHETLLSALQHRWRVRKWFILVVVAAVSFFAGQIPLLQSLCLALAFIAIHLMLIREPLRWLPTGRKIFARLDIKLIGVVLTVINLAVNVLVIPFVGINGVVLAMLGVVNTFIFVRFSTQVVETRLQWELQHIPFGRQDWFRVALCVGGIVILLLAGTLMMWTMIEFLLGLSIPFLDMRLGDLLLEREVLWSP